ncbi:hypothetical protein K440DRAFT_614160 [Wilcoxina mikolae CBS 423.85]|nr:hypothetical protein K440DRAFT_614160 [Wilcoxina mikolae CBS 423.85]
MSVLSPIPVNLTRKRSPSIAFDDATPPSSRPPSRAHTKRYRFSKHATERPSWVIDRDSSTRVDSRIDGFTRMDVRFPNNTLAIARPVGGLMRSGGFTVLCFLGMGGETTLRSVGAVAGLLENLGAVSYGVSLGRVDVNVNAVPIIHDSQGMLTKRLGLLHPLGGGRTALDAIVVLDAESRARMVLPIGWGARGDDVGNRWENVVARLVRGVEWLRGEMAEIGGREIEMLMG